MKISAPPGRRAVSKVFTGTPGTTIPTSVNPVGDYSTILQFQSVIIDDVPGVIDMVNHHFNIPAGFFECRVSYCLAWGGNATGWRGMRIKNNLGSNYGNVRAASVGANTSTNNQYISPWMRIVPVISVAPNTIAVGDDFDFWPAQTCGVDLLAGADTASSWCMIEFR